MTSAPVPPTPRDGRWLRPLTPHAAAKFKRSLERGPLRFVGKHVLLWSVLGALGFGAIHAAMTQDVFVREVLRAFMPLCVLGLWLGLIKWNLLLLGDDKRREAGGDPTDRRKHPGVVLILLIGVLVVWFPGRFYLYQLDRRVQAAIADGQPSDHQTEAAWLLRLAWLYPLDWGHGNALHHAHTALGLAALERGDIAAAGEHLLKAGHTPGSPQLDTFGPNMALAKALLEHGERDVVLRYLDECRDFWRMDDGDLDEWSAAVRANETPDFGANLVH